MRIGNGYDVHRLCEGRPLILGGVNIPFDKGLMGHSDADVLLHAIADALLGAAGLYDIGRHFPDSNEEFKDISSLILLERVAGKLEYKIANIDCIIVAQTPRLAAFIDEMRENIALACGISAGRVNVKATTEEGLGFTGTGQGIAAYAVALLE